MGAAGDIVSVILFCALAALLFKFAMSKEI
jgi:hypothetical protein